MTQPTSPQIRPTAQETAAWLLWCFDQGYTHAEDRAILTNWLLDDLTTLHEDDLRLRGHLLQMATELLTAIRQETKCARSGRTDA